jgi:hypothetical protein
MFFNHPSMAVFGWHNQRHAQFPPCCATQAGSVWGGSFLHARTVTFKQAARIPSFVNVDSNSMKTEYWPGTKIVKSTNNGFTRPPGVSCMHTPFEETKARKQSQAEENGHAAQKARKKGFGHATLKGLSKRGLELLNKAPHSINLGPTKGARKASI